MNFKILTSLLTALIFIGNFSICIADQVTIVFNNAPPTNLGCYDSWVEDGFTIEILPESANGNCNPPNYYSGYGLWPIYGSPLSIDVSHLGFIQQVAINGSNYCSSAPYFKFYNNGVEIDDIDGSDSFNGDLYYNNVNNYNIDEFRIFGCELTLYSITIKYTPTETCEPQNLVNARSGDFYVDEACHGVILTAPDGSCYRVKVQNGGALVSEVVSCP